MASDPRDELIAELRAIIAQQRETIAKLEARLAVLEERLNQDSTNSGKPPSADPPGARPEKPPTGRRRGGQPGHKPHKRVLLPAEKVTRRTEVRPDACRCCGGRHLARTNEAPRVHQVIEVPEVRPDVHEVRMHAGTCRDCGETTWGTLPAGVPAHMFGPRLLALIAYFVAGRLSRRLICEVLAELFGIPVSLGALSEAEERASTAIEQPVDQAVAHVRAQRVKHVDASTWRRQGTHAALWTIATRLVTVFFVTADATGDTVKALLGRLRGILVTDRGSQFGFWAMERRQICWAHLIRKFVAFSERRDQGARLGESLLLVSHAVLHKWHDVRDGTVSRKEYQAFAANAQIAVENLLEQGVALALPRLSGSCKDILVHRAALFTFAFKAGVEPTNNRAERALRPFVLWRKVSYGSQSERGCLFAQRVMTVAHTLRQQKRSIFAFLVDACQAHAESRRAPSLLPSTR